MDSKLTVSEQVDDAGVPAVPGIIAGEIFRSANSGFAIIYHIRGKQRNCYLASNIDTSAKLKRGVFSRFTLEAKEASASASRV